MVSDGSTALLLAARKSQQGVARLLLDRGADPNATRTGGQAGATPLMSAAFNGATGLVRLLLDRGADPDLVKATGARGTAVLMAAGRGHAEVLQLLAVFGANLSAQVGGL